MADDIQGYDLERKGDIKINLSDLYRELGDYEYAYNNLILYRKIQDSLKLEDQAKYAQEKKAKYQNKAYPARTGQTGS